MAVEPDPMDVPVGPEVRVSPDCGAPAGAAVLCEAAAMRLNSLKAWTVKSNGRLKQPFDLMSP
jgi:hypothetical protein